MVSFTFTYSCFKMSMRQNTNVKGQVRIIFITSNTPPYVLWTDFKKIQFLPQLFSGAALKGVISTYSAAMDDI